MTRKPLATINAALAQAAGVVVDYDAGMRGPGIENRALAALESLKNLTDQPDLAEAVEKLRSYPPSLPA